MRSLPYPIGFLAVGLSLLVAGVPTIASAQQGISPPLPSVSSRSTPAASTRTSRTPVTPLASMPMEQIAPEVRARIQAVLDRPTLRSQGQTEAFNCQPEQYYWLLDNPQLAVRLWRALGAKVTDIESQGQGRFTYKDDLGSRVSWETVLRTTEYRVWYAEGKVKPGYLLPTVTLRAVLAIRHNEGYDADGKAAIRHQVELVLQTDNAAVALAARLLGASAPHMAQQFVSQIEMFFGAMAWYLDQHPRHAASMLADLERPERTKPPPVRPATLLRPGGDG